MSVQKITGKAASFKYNGNVLSITKYTTKGKRELADSTGSDNYDATTDLVWTAQLAAAAALELDVEGQWDLNSTNAQLAAQLVSGATAVPVILNMSAAVIQGHGNFDISDFTVDTETGEKPKTITWKASFKSNGVFTYGS